LTAERALATRAERAQDAAPPAFAAAPAVPLHAGSALGFPRHDFAAIPVRPQLQRQHVGEDPALAARRLAAADAARNAAERIQRALRLGLLWALEAPVPGGVVFGPDGKKETFAERAARLRELAIDLGHFASELEQTMLTPERLSPEFPEAEATYEPGGTQVRKDTLILYARREIERGRKKDPMFRNTFYIDVEPLPTPQAPRAFTSTATDVGLISVPDPENAPLVFQRVTGFEDPPTKKGARVVTVWEDDFGFFYNRKGRKFYLPGRP
jgi:hypothetical protein